MGAEGSIEKGFILDPEAKMQSRIDEQSELICILKKRADQLLTESKSNERRLKNAEKTNADLVVQLKNEKQRVLMVEERFSELADNHGELIKFKDMHKNSATRLREENDILRSQNESIITPALLEKDRQIEEWRLKNQHLYERIEQLEIENSELHHEVKTLKESDTQKSLKLVELSNEIETILKEKNELQVTKDKELNELEEKWSQDYKKVKNEKDDLFMTSLDRGKRLQAKEEEISRLQSEIGELNSRIRAIDSEWRDAKNKLSKDSTFKRLSQENEKLKGAMEAKEREFVAYKNHTNELLEKEKFLNKRLRQYSLKIDQ